MKTTGETEREGLSIPAIYKEHICGSAWNAWCHYYSLWELWARPIALKKKFSVSERVIHLNNVSPKINDSQTYYIVLTLKLSKMDRI